MRFGEPVRLSVVRLLNVNHGSAESEQETREEDKLKLYLEPGQRCCSNFSINEQWGRKERGDV